MLKSYAKVNLFLNVVGRRSDKYHNLQSYCVLLNLADQIDIQSSKSTECLVENHVSITDNLILKVIDYINRLYQTQKSVKICIKKYIPIGSGLGGGSSNAAAVLKILPKLWSVPKLNTNHLHQIAFTIGADIPFFYYNQNSLIEGIGEKITPIHHNGTAFILLINPMIKIMTKEIYPLINTYVSSKILSTKEQIINEVLYGKNDLERYVRNKYQTVDDLLHFMKKQTNCLVSRMSGSGSTCFALFQKQDDLINAKQEFLKVNKNFWIHHEKIYI